MTGLRRIAHVFATFGAGGPQVRAVQLMTALGPAIEHHVLAMDGDTAAAAQVPSSLQVQIAPAPPRSGFLASVRARTQWLRALRPDLVLTYNWGAIESVLAAKRLGLSVVHHEDGFLPDEAQHRLARRNWLRRWLLRGVPVIVPSAVLARIAREEWWVRSVHHLPNGVDLHRFAPVSRPPGAAPTFGTVGGLRPEKDHATLLRAVAQVPDAALQIVGDGPLRPALTALASELGLAGRVQFLGATRDTAACYGAFDGFVLSSRTEQMPLVLLEAMAAGLPVVATDVGDVRAVLPDSAAPFVVSPQDPGALAAAMRTLLGDGDLRRRLGADNRARVVERYAAPTCLERFLAVYRAAVAAHSPA